MRTKHKTRFTIIFDGIYYELFSATECKERGLAIYNKKDNRYDQPTSKEEIEIREDRYSVHPSNASKTNTTIKRTTTYSDKRVLTAAQLISNSKTELICPLYTKCCSIPTELQYCTPNAFDDNLTIGEYRSSDRTTLVISVIVASADCKLPSLDGFTLNQAIFSRYKIAVYSSYLNVPSCNHAMLTTWATSPIRLDNINLGDTAPKPAPSTLISDLGKLILNNKEECASHYINCLISKAPYAYGEALRRQQLYFHSTPEDLDLGRRKRDILGLFLHDPSKRH